jgi:hypothetical protein
LLLTKYYESNNVKDDEDRSCSTDGGEEKFIKDFCGKIRKKIDHLENGRIVFKCILKNSERTWVGEDSAG